MMRGVQGVLAFLTSRLHHERVPVLQNKTNPEVKNIFYNAKIGRLPSKSAEYRIRQVPLPKRTERRET